MMNDMTSARLSLPLMQSGQAQKEITHNEALALLDLTVAASAVAMLDTPPADPEPGQCWLVGDTPTGDWAGHAGAIAGWTQGGWRFVVVPSGARVWSEADQFDWRRIGKEWIGGDLRGDRLVLQGNAILGPRQAAIPDPAGGMTVDTQARAALAVVLAVLRGHGLIEE